MIAATQSPKDPPTTLTMTLVFSNPEMRLNDGRRL
jgi:hypothetical protein